MKFACDENFNGALLKALKNRIPDLDVIRVQDTDMMGFSDPDLLERLNEMDSILLTHDAKTMPTHVYERINRGLEVAGVVLIRQTISIGELAEQLEILILATEPHEFKNVIHYIPM